VFFGVFKKARFYTRASIKTGVFLKVEKVGAGLEKSRKMLKIDLEFLN
jgi:hypothetical protein